VGEGPGSLWIRTGAGEFTAESLRAGLSGPEPASGT